MGRTRRKIVALLLSLSSAGRRYLEEGMVLEAPVKKTLPWLVGWIEYLALRYSLVLLVGRKRRSRRKTRGEKNTAK